MENRGMRVNMGNGRR